MHRLREQFLLHRIRVRHDTQAYAEIYEQYAERITRFIRLKVASMEDAEELQSEVFEQAWESLCKTRVINLSAYLYTIARRVVADHYRKNERRVKETSLAEGSEIADSIDLQSAVTQSSDLATVEKALYNIFEEYRELIVMRFMDEMSITEIARALQKTPNNVRVSIHRALGALKRAIEELSHHT
ncbi:RNA polymerase sigma factor [Candidatus Uhrbacteria bacterium]|nr:RNA polymerase sigma factor [Candidatus Uhrbacteria bacterium]